MYVYVFKDMGDKNINAVGKLDLIDQRIERLIEQKKKYIQLWGERRDRQTPKLQKTITIGMEFISKRLEQIKKLEEKQRILDERIRVSELQIQSRRKVIQKAQEKLREYEDCEPGVGETIKKERESTE